VPASLVHIYFRNRRGKVLRSLGPLQGVECGAEALVVLRRGLVDSEICKEVQEGSHVVFRVLPGAEDDFADIVDQLLEDDSYNEGPADRALLMMLQVLHRRQRS
jgi:hypothetical protein